MFRRPARIVMVMAVAFNAACGGGKSEAPAHNMPVTPTVTPGAPLTPREGGKVISVDMITDDRGNNRFIPDTFDAHPGDVMRFVLVSGVHNVNFLPDSNPSLTSAPAPSPLLQLPGQTYDIAVDFEPGRYFFQCDPHALLGMVGYVTVKPRDD